MIVYIGSGHGGPLFGSWLTGGIPHMVHGQCHFLTWILANGGQFGIFDENIGPSIRRGKFSKFTVGGLSDYSSWRTTSKHYERGRCEKSVCSAENETTDE